MNRFCVAVSMRAAACAAAVAAVCGAAHAAPATAGALALMPKEAQVAIALPPITESLQAYVDFAKKVSPQVDIEGELKKVITDLAADANAEGAESLQDIFTARGLDPAQPVAAFLDFSKSIAEMKAAEKGGQDDTSEDTVEVEKLDRPGADKEDAAGDEEKSDGDAVHEADEEVMEAGQAPEPGDPAFVVVAGVTDKAKVEELVKEIASEVPGLDPAASETVEQGGVPVSVNGDYGHFTTDTHLVIGTKDLVLATAAQWGDKREVRYGGSDVPAGEHEIVALVYPDRLFPLADQLLPALGLDDTTMAIAKAQVTAFKEALKSEGGEDPIYITHSVAGNRSDLQIRIDTDTHPGYRNLVGEAQPLRLARLLPENTLALLTMRFNEQAKKQLAEQILPALQDSGEQAAVFAVPAIQMIGDEITIGIAAAENDFPAAYIMIALAEPEAAKGMLTMLVPSMPGETYNGEEIKAIAAPIPVPVSMATPGDVVILSNNVDGLKKIIDLQKGNEKTKMFESLKDPMNPETPRYQALIFKSQLITDVVMPLSSLAGGLPDDIGPAVTQGSAAIDEIRYVSEVRDNWNVAQLTLYLK